jgi:hypothetical protein
VEGVAAIGKEEALDSQAQDEVCEGFAIAR